MCVKILQFPPAAHRRVHEEIRVDWLDVRQVIRYVCVCVCEIVISSLADNVYCAVICHLNVRVSCKTVKCAAVTCSYMN